MSGVLDRTLSVLELLAQHGHGLELANIADQLSIPRSGTHRLLTDLIRRGYVRQVREHGAYVLTTKLVAIGLSYLGNTGIVDIAQPLLDQLASQSGELVRLSVIDGERLTWVARAQGARQGLRYDPDMGSDARLSCSASGIAWLMTCTDEEALSRVARQGLGQSSDYGPNAPANLKEFLKRIHAARKTGYSLTLETYTAGLNAMAAPVRPQGLAAIGVLSIAGPSSRLSAEKMRALAPELLKVVEQLAAASRASPFFNKQPSEMVRQALAQPIYAP